MIRAMRARLAALILGERPEGQLPRRVQDAIARREVEAEKLIGWAQLSVGVVWATLYLIAPRATAVMTFEPVPIALGLYLGFTAFRLFLSYHSRPQAWFLALSVVVDMALLMGLIWSFHLQYRQPAAFYLKAPTLLYVFIFIGLRALRFSVGYVLLAGLSAALGWLILVWYAVATYPQPGLAITRDFAVYVMSNTILLGAEFDKVISILLTTGILAVAIVRARRLLVAAVADEAARSALSRFFAPEVAAEITNAERPFEPGEGVSRQAAALFCDVRGFTGLAMRMSPNALMALLAEYQHRICAAIQAHGGSIDKFLGDGILASFGAARPSESFAADALRALEAALEAAEGWAAERRRQGLEPLGIGFAVAAGPLVFGAVGDPARLELTVIGEPVNLAAKLEKHTKIEGAPALTTTETLAIAEGQGYAPSRPFERRPDRRVDGLGQPLDLIAYPSAPPLAQASQASDARAATA
jgi:adenylate cyclase